jgi:hypothetical protein
LQQDRHKKELQQVGSEPLEGQEEGLEGTSRQAESSQEDQKVLWEVETLLLVVPPPYHAVKELQGAREAKLDSNMSQAREEHLSKKNVSSER